MTSGLYLGAISVAVALCSPAFANSAPEDVQKEEMNRNIVLHFYKEPDHEKRLDFMADNYIQHNPTIAEGKEGVRAFFASLPKHVEQRVIRVAADGDLVWVHLHTIPNPGERGSAVANIFRLENGKIAEHWDVLEPVPEKSANKNSMFTSTSLSSYELALSEVRNPQKEEANRKVILEFYKDLNSTRRANLLAEDYEQHNPAIPNGKEAVAKFHDELLKKFPNTKQTLLRTAAYGDYVWSHFSITSGPGDLGRVVIGIFRLKNGKIVEHWDVAQSVPAKSVNKNPMF